MKGTEMYELSGRAEGVDWSDVAAAGRAYADNIVGEPAVTAAMHSMADEIDRLRAEVERLRQLGKRNAQDLREYAAALGGEMADMVADECKITVKRMF